MTLCVHNAHLVTAAGIRSGGVLAAEGRIVALLADGDKAAADTVIDAAGLMLFPGFVDAHVHMRDPGLTHKEDFAHGTTAAACGGVTTVMCMPNVHPPMDCAEAVLATRAAGEAAANVDFTLQGSMTAANIGDLEAIWATGITSFELGLSDGGEGKGIVRMDNPAILREGLAATARLDALVGIYTGSQPISERLAADLKEAGRRDARAHAEARPAITEAIGVSVLSELAAEAGARIVYRQICSRRGFEIMRRLKRERPTGSVVVEVTPHNLRLTDAAIDRLGTLAQIIPPLRSEDDMRAAVIAAADGTADFIGSDHAPHALAEKLVEDAWTARNGSPGLDTVAAAALDLAAKGGIGYPDVARLLCESPARIFGLEATKGALSVGADADLVLVDPDETRTVTRDMIRSKAKYSVFEGQALRGWPVLTVLRGQIIAERGRLIAPGRGRFVARGARSHG